MSNDARARRGLMFVISSPSGAGKTTLSNRLRQAHDDLTLSISATTRAPREGEIDGEDYHFLDRAMFERLRGRNHFFEWAEVHGHYYGTPKEPVMEMLENGCDVLLDIDWQGAQQMFQQRDRDVVSVFVLPPSMKELAARLRKRAQDPEAVIKKRLKGAVEEITHWAEYDYVLVNDDVDETAATLDAILRAERQRRFRQPWLNDFVHDLLGQKP